MQSVSSMIWTRVTVSISYSNNHYITGTSRVHVFIIFTSYRHSLYFGFQYFDVFYVHQLVYFFKQLTKFASAYTFLKCMLLWHHRYNKYVMVITLLSGISLCGLSLQLSFLLLLSVRLSSFSMFFFNKLYDSWWISKCTRYSDIKMCKTVYYPALDIIRLLIVNPRLLLGYSTVSFSHKRQPMVSFWNLNESKTPQVSNTLLRIQADLNNAVV